MKKVSYKKYSLLFVTSLLFLFHCNSQKSNNSREITLTFWHSFVSSTLPALESLIASFENEHPNIKIKAQYVPTGDVLAQKLITAIQSKTAPDISWIHSDFLGKLAGAKAIYPVDQFIQKDNEFYDSELNDIFPQLLRSATWRDTLFAVPMEATCLVLLYNKSLFRKAGLDPDHPPTNWEELRNYSQRLTIDKNQNGKIDQFGFYIPVFSASGPLSIWMVLQWSPFLWQAGGEIISEDQSKVLFNSISGVQALSLWKNLFDDMQFKKFTMAHDLGFASQKLAMVMDGPWNLPRYRQMNNFDWGVASLPEGPEKKATYLAGEHLAIFKQSKHPQEAWTFIKWIIDPNIQAEFSIQSGYLPVRKSTLKLENYQNYLKSDPALKMFVEQLKIGIGRRTIDHFGMEINQCIAEAVENCLLGNEDPKTALDHAAEKANILLAKKNK